MGSTNGGWHGIKRPRACQIGQRDTPPLSTSYELKSTHPPSFGLCIDLPVSDIFHPSRLSKHTMNILYSTFVGILTCLFVADRIVRYVAAARFKKAHGCKPERKIPQFERIIGYGLLKTQIRAVKEKRLLEVSKQRFEEYGTTWSVSVMGNVFINTIEPENIKAILATNFKDFGLGKRIESLGDLLGNGIFTSDGAAWEHSRVSTFLFSSRDPGPGADCYS